MKHSKRTLSDVLSDRIVGFRVDATVDKRLKAYQKQQGLHNESEAWRQIVQLGLETAERNARILAAARAEPRPGPAGLVA